MRPHSTVFASAWAWVWLAAVVSPAIAAPVAWNQILDQPATWYGSLEARGVADYVIRYQRRNGGWPKDIDMTVAPRAAQARASSSDATIDNGATVTQIRLLDRVFVATARPAYRDAALKGIDYLLSAQYPNGGWPQFYPLRNDYSRHITFNDEAMTGVLALFEDLVDGRALAFAGEPRRTRARDAIARATAVILRAQIRVDGRLTAWCAQHDAVTLEPRPARSYEHVSISGRESVDVIRFLMRREPTAEIVAAVEAASAWLRSVAMRDSTGQAVWARFYEIGTNRPIYSGRDGIVRYAISEIEAERRTGYAWTGRWPAQLLEKDYPAWRARVTALSGPSSPGR